MGAPAVTYTFANSTTADASQVNQNFADVINGVSDGTKDLSIAALTVAGSATFNGNCTFGNASGDDVTFTGSLASSIPVKTTNSFNVGDSTHGLASIYFGANSQTVRILPSSSLAATWTMTLPTTAGTNLYLLRTNGSGVTSWAQIDSNGMFTTGAAATAAAIGIVSTTSQTFGGLKTFQDGVDYDVIDLGDAAATRLGYKEYLAGTTYNAVPLTVTGTNYVVGDGLFVPYQTQAGNWRLRFNINGALTSGTPTSLSLTIAGVTFLAMSGTNEGQACSAFTNANAATRARTADNGSTLTLTCASASTTWTVSGDVRLASKPTWAF